MCRFAALILFVLGQLASAGAAACHVVRPDPHALVEYEAIFLGTVTGIHLKGYEDRLVGNPGGFIDDMPLFITDGSSPVSVTAVVSTSAKGSASGALELRLVGCTAPLPALRERGIFFVRAGDSSAATVWESDPEEFAQWLSKLGIRPDGL